MDDENNGLGNRFGPPPIMPWALFVDWIGMSEHSGKVEAWIQRGYIPKVKIGKHVMVNVALFIKELHERDSSI